MFLNVRHSHQRPPSALRRFPYIDVEQNIADWYEASLRYDNVHVLWYEDMLCNCESVLRRLADTTGSELSPTLCASILKQTSYEAMTNRLDVFSNIYKGGGTHGRGRKILSEASLMAMEQRWASVVASRIPAATSYSALFEHANGYDFPY